MKTRPCVEDGVLGVRLPADELLPPFRQFAIALHRRGDNAETKFLLEDMVKLVVCEGQIISKLTSTEWL